MHKVELGRPLNRHELFNALHSSAQMLMRTSRLTGAILAFACQQPVFIDDAVIQQLSFEPIGPPLPLKRRVGVHGHRQLGLEFYIPLEGRPTRRLLLAGPYSPAFKAYGGFAGKVKRLNDWHAVLATYTRAAIALPSELNLSSHTDPTPEEHLLGKLYIESALLSASKK